MMLIVGLLVSVPVIVQALGEPGIVSKDKITPDGRGETLQVM